MWSINNDRISLTSSRKPSANPLETGREFRSDLAAYNAAMAEIVDAEINPIAEIVSVIYVRMSRL